ncbi:MAG: glycosyl transferase [Bacilli bacterium]|nr:glycosyl transferase [Bacilli bacterium]
MNIERAREVLAPAKILEKEFPNREIDDAVRASFAGNTYLGITGLNKKVPILDYLMLDEKFATFTKNFKDQTVLLDLDHYYIKNEKHELNPELRKLVLEAKEYFENYGGCLNENGEHIVDLKSMKVGPHYDVNLLLGDRRGFEEPLLTTPKSVVDSFGAGSSRGPAGYQVLATRWDMRPEENGNPFNRQFYILEDGKQIFYSHNVNENVKKAYAVHKVNKTEIYYETLDGLKIKRVIFLLPQIKGNPIATESQSVEITNLTSKERNLKVVFTGFFGSSNPGCQMVDVIYQSVINQSIVEADNNGIIAIAPDYYPEYCKREMRFFILKNDEGFADNFCYDASAFLGNGDIYHPQYLNHLNNAAKFKGPSFFALDKSYVLKAKGKVTFDTYVGVVNATKTKGDENLEVFKKELQSLLESVKTHKGLERIIAKRDKYLAQYSSFLKVESDNKEFDDYINKNLPFQILYQTYVSRAFAQTQKGYREIGFREIQDIYSSMYYYLANGEERLVRSLLEKWIVNVYEFGYVNHNFFYVGKEPGMCSDDGLWLVEAIYRYMCLSGDKTLLRKRFKVAGSKKSRTLYETLKAIITYSSKISVGKHGLPLLDKADWNDCLKIDDDCLDGPTKEKLYRQQLRKKKQKFGVPFENELSESVMNAFLLVIMVDNMKVIASKLGDEDYVKEMAETKDRLVKSLKENAYINGYYARVLINRDTPMNGITYVGAPKDGLSLQDDFDGSIYLNSFSWSILSGVATEEEIASMIKLIDRYLKTEAGYKLCSKHNLLLCGSKEAATEQYFPGDRENGGVFKHATMMFVDALFKAIPTIKDKILAKTLKDDAYYMLDIVYPYNVLANPYGLKGNPRWCTQYVNSITNEHIGPILSGTSTWLLISTLESLGIKFNSDEIVIRPVLRDEVKYLKLKIHIQNSYYEIELHNDCTLKEIVMPYYRDGKLHKIS